MQNVHKIIQTPHPFTNPKELAEAGERIYKEKFQRKLEKESTGSFVAIDVTTESIFVAEEPQTALEMARKSSPKGVFHLIRIGSPGAFKVSYSTHATRDWLFQ